MNQIWLLRPIDYETHWEPWYDKAFGFVISAPSEEAARQIAAKEAGDEDESGDVPGYAHHHPFPVNPWLDPKFTSCEPVNPDDAVGVLVRDYRSA